MISPHEEPGGDYYERQMHRLAFEAMEALQKDFVQILKLPAGPSQDAAVALTGISILVRKVGELPEQARADFYKYLFNVLILLSPTPTSEPWKPSAKGEMLFWSHVKKLAMGEL